MEENQGVRFARRKKEVDASKRNKAPFFHSGPMMGGGGKKSFLRKADKKVKHLVKFT